MATIGLDRATSGEKDLITPTDVQMTANTVHTDSSYVFYECVTNSLTVVASSLDAAQEASLREVIARRLSHGQAYTGHGSVTSVRLGGAAVDCFYLLLQQTCPVEEGMEEEQEDSQPAYVVCFLHPQEGTLDLFRQQLDMYSSQLTTHLITKMPLGEQVRPVLAAWHHASVEFLSRILQALGNQVALLLHCALLNAHIEVKGTSQQLREDIQKFCACCGLGDLIQDSRPLSPDSQPFHEASPPPSAGSLTNTSVTLSRGVWAFSDERCNRFCVEWAKALLNGGCQSPAYLKQLVDSYKLQAIQDMNTFKRLVRQAEVDHYALYRAFHFLQTSGNCDVLLHHATASDHTLTTPDAASVIQVLQENVQETSSLER